METSGGFAGRLVTGEATVASVVRDFARVYQERPEAGVNEYIASFDCVDDEPQADFNAETAIHAFCEYAYVFSAGATSRQTLRVLMAIWRRGRMVWTELATVDLGAADDPAWDELDRFALTKVAESLARK